MGCLKDRASTQGKGSCLGIEGYILLSRGKLSGQEFSEPTHIGQHPFIGLLGGGFFQIGVNDKPFFMVALEYLSFNIKPNGGVKISNVFWDTQLVSSPLDVKPITTIVKECNRVIGLMAILTPVK